MQMPSQRNSYYSIFNKISFYYIEMQIQFSKNSGGDGRAYEARGWSIESDHSPIHGNSSLSIAFIGE